MSDGHRNYAIAIDGWLGSGHLRPELGAFDRGFLRKPQPPLAREILTKRDQSRNAYWH